MFSNVKAVRVQEVIMSGSSNVIGNIRYNDLNEDKPLSTPQLNQARPLFKNISQPPSVNEIVYVLGGPDGDGYNDIGKSIGYYLPPINVFGSPNHNAYFNELNPEELEAGSETSLDYFKEVDSIRPMQPYLGDIMFEGRYGQSIRFGSTVNINPDKGGSHIPNNWSNVGEIGKPITIISNGQTKNPLERGERYEHILEDINGDDSSIYLCSDQQITNFKKAGIGFKFHEASYKHMLLGIVFNEDGSMKI
tara:strand:+ start:818 stop:1564 length:747 start_codon:yes stop_codon:yes gene_type:complete